MERLIHLHTTFSRATTTITTKTKQINLRKEYYRYLLNLFTILSFSSRCYCSCCFCLKTRVSEVVEHRKVEEEEERIEYIDAREHGKKKQNEKES